MKNKIFTLLIITIISISLFIPFITLTNAETTNIGITTIGANWTNMNYVLGWAYGFLSPTLTISEHGYISAITAYLKSDTESSLTVSLYTANNTMLINRVGTTMENTITSTTGNWYTFTFTDAIEVNTGNYGIVFTNATTQPVYIASNDGTGTKRFYYFDTKLGSTWVNDGTYGDIQDISAYFTFEDTITILPTVTLTENKDFRINTDHVFTFNATATNAELTELIFMSNITGTDTNTTYSLTGTNQIKNITVTLNANSYDRIKFNAYVVDNNTNVNDLGEQIKILTPRYYNPNFVWIMNAGWTASNPNCLTQNLTKVVNNCYNNNITIANVFVGYYNGTENKVIYEHSDSYFTTVINAFHAKNIKVYAWIESANSYGYNLPDISPSNYNNMYNILNTTLRKGFDGINDDLEGYELEDWLQYTNNATVFVHTLNKNYTSCSPYDYTMILNSRLKVDYSQVMFYGMTSLFENPSIDAYWQEHFGTYNGNNKAVISPQSIGIMNYYGNSKPLAYQLNKITELMNTYPHEQLTAFGIWLYEYMTDADWITWKTWINNLNPPNPISVNATISAIPQNGYNGIVGRITYNGIDLTLPSIIPAIYGQQITITMPLTVTNEEHNILLGSSTTNSLTGQGYYSFTYFTKAIQLETTITFNKIIIKTDVNTNINIALYQRADNQSLIKLNDYGTRQTTKGWNIINVNNQTLEMGIYYIGIKTDTNSAFFTTGENGYYTNDGYEIQFKNLISTLETGTGSPQIYLSDISPTITTLYAKKWNDETLSLTKTFNITENTDLTMIYDTMQTLTPEPTITPTITPQPTTTINNNRYVSLNCTSLRFLNVTSSNTFQKTILVTNLKNETQTLNISFTNIYPVNLTENMQIVTDYDNSSILPYQSLPVKVMLITSSNYDNATEFRFYININGESILVTNINNNLNLMQIAIVFFIAVIIFGVVMVIIKKISRGF